MINIWSKVSKIGVDVRVNPLFNREKIIFNRIVLLLIFTFIAILLLDIINNQLKGIGSSLSTVRIIIILLLCFLHLGLNQIRFFRLSKILLSIHIPFFLIVFPTLLGNVINEYVLWYPFVPAALSIVPHFIFDYKKEKRILILILFYYFVLAASIDYLLFILSPSELSILPIIKENYFIFKASHLIFFGFINAALFYLFKTNKNYENLLLDANEILGLQKEELRSQNDELIAQQEELNDKNQELELVLNQLKRTQSQLIQSEKMASLGILISGIAHEINNPLNYINGNLECLESALENNIYVEDLKSERDKLSVDIRQMMSDINSGVDKVTEIVQSLMTFSFRGESAKRAVNINKMIDSTIQILNYKIHPNIQIEKNYSDMPLVNCYQDQFHQVLLNIFLNAIDAIAEKKPPSQERIVISTSFVNNEKGIAKITISNSGSQIKETDIKKVFDPFFTTKEPNKGKGLGLSIAYNLIEEHKGTLSVRNNDGMVEFCIQIPI